MAATIVLRQARPRTELNRLSWVMDLLPKTQLLVALGTQDVQFVDSVSEREMDPDFGTRG